jgi:hypothetical protein
MGDGEPACPVCGNRIRPSDAVASHPDGMCHISCAFPRVRVQGHEARERAEAIGDDARRTIKRSHEQYDRADVCAREAEAAQQSSRDVKRGVIPADGDGHAGVGGGVLQLGQPVRHGDRSDIGVIVGLVFGSSERALVRWVDGPRFELMDVLIEVRLPT